MGVLISSPLDCNLIVNRYSRPELRYSKIRTLIVVVAIIVTLKLGDGSSAKSNTNSFRQY